MCEHACEDPRTKVRDPLVGLTKYVDFEALAASIDAAAPGSSSANGARPPYPTVLMVKILILQQFYNLAVAGACLASRHHPSDIRLTP